MCGVPGSLWVRGSGPESAPALAPAWGWLTVLISQWELAPVLAPAPVLARAWGWLTKLISQLESEQTRVIAPELQPVSTPGLCGLVGPSPRKSKRGGRSGFWGQRLPWNIDPDEVEAKLGNGLRCLSSRHFGHNRSMRISVAQVDPSDCAATCELGIRIT